VRAVQTCKSRAEPRAAGRGPRGLLLSYACIGRRPTAIGAALP